MTLKEPQTIRPIPASPDIVPTIFLQTPSGASLASFLNKLVPEMRWSATSAMRRRLGIHDA
jgi:hypothetical protein